MATDTDTRELPTTPADAAVASRRDFLRRAGLTALVAHVPSALGLLRAKRSPRSVRRAANETAAR